MVEFQICQYTRPAEMIKFVYFVAGLLLAVAICVLVAYAKWCIHGCRTFSSSLYIGEVFHSRFLTANHHFQYPLFFSCINLKEVKLLSSILWPLFCSSLMLFVDCFSICTLFLIFCVNLAPVLLSLNNLYLLHLEKYCFVNKNYLHWFSVSCTSFFRSSS